MEFRMRAACEGSSALGRETQRLEAAAQLALEGRAHVNLLARLRMLEADGDGGQREPVQAVLLTKIAIVLALAVVHVADDRTRHVFEVTAHLVPASRQRLSFYQRVASVYAQAAHTRHCSYPRPSLMLLDRVIDLAILWAAACERPITLVHATLFERFTQLARA